jgi:hypothetical protein
VFLTAEAAATLAGAVAGPFLAQALHFNGVATVATLVTLSAAALTFLTVPRVPALPFPATETATITAGRRPAPATWPSWSPTRGGCGFRSRWPRNPT